MKTIRILPLLVLLASPFAFVSGYVFEFLAVDSALDSGASWDYVAGRADFSQPHPFIPYTERHALLFSLSAISLCAVVLYVVLLHTVFRSPCDTSSCVPETSP